jgi:hypothetical protein
MPSHSVVGLSLAYILTLGIYGAGSLRLSSGGLSVDRMIKESGELFPKSDNAAGDSFVTLLF